MSRLPVAAFVALVLATVAAFFVTQHLKVTTPLVAGDPSPVPSHINPVNGKRCRVYTRLGVSKVSFRRMHISFYLLHRADDVDVYMIDRDRSIVATLASGRHMAKKQRTPFAWDGREDSGAVAPDGTYYIKVSLIHEGRSLLIPRANSSGPAPVVVETRPPALRLVSVTPRAIAAVGGGASSDGGSGGAGGAAVTIRYTGNDGLRPRVLIYRVGSSGGVRLVKSYEATSRGGKTVWNGTVQGGAAAPRGSYLVGLKLTDLACNTATSPARLPPTVGSDPDASVSVG